MILKRKPKLPSLDQVKHGVEEILLQKWDDIKFRKSSKKYFKELEKLFLSKIGIIPYGILPMNGNEMKVKCYRVRQLDTTLDTQLISDFSHPPKHLSKKILRANLPGHPVFYCSPDAKTALIETIRDKFDKKNRNVFFLSEWSFRTEHKYNVIPFIYGNTSELNTFKNLGEGILLNFKKQNPELTNEDVEVLSEILKFLAGLFVFENTYTVSSFIAHSHLYAPHQFRGDIFIYPSTQTDRHTINFAIHPNTVTHKMKLDKIFGIKIKDFDYEADNLTAKLDFQTLQVGRNIDGIINWQDFTKNDFEELKKLFPNSDNKLQ